MDKKESLADLQRLLEVASKLEAEAYAKAWHHQRRTEDYLDDAERYHRTGEKIRKEMEELKGSG